MDAMPNSTVSLADAKTTPRTLATRAFTPGAASGRAVIAVMALLTTIDLFAIQALVPSLADAYSVTPAAMGTAVNASTLGMAIGGLAVALFGHRVSPRRGVIASLVLLALPTLALAGADSLAGFALLRVGQGVCMAAAFTLTLAHLGERCGVTEKSGAFAAYITGNVASNLFGRLIAVAAADHLGLAASFFTFAALNLAGAALAFAAFGRGVPATKPTAPRMGTSLALWARHAGDPALRSAFAVGFCILFAFIGTFTYINFVLVRPPFSLGMMAVGFVYLVFAPSIATTPLAGRAVARLGTRRMMWTALAIAALGLPLTLTASLAATLAGLAMIGVGTFLAQAAATGFVGRAATDTTSASGLYLAAYFLGGLAGAFACGHAFTQFGWPGCVATIAASLASAAIFARRMTTPSAQP
jgi:predicted MFS family arabinose efflux permease